MSATRPSILLTHWHRVLREHGNRIGVIDFVSDSSHTFAQIEMQAQQIESELRPVIATGEATHCAAQAVLLCLPNGAQWLSAYLAIHRCGAVIVPIEPEPDGAVIAAKHGALCRQLHAIAKIDAGGIAAISQADINKAVAEPAPQTGTGSSTASKPQQHRTTQSHLIKLTSGSTGQPQALEFSEANMVADGLNIIAGMGLRADMLNYAAIPFGHSYGLGNLVLPFLLQGTAVACASGILPRVIAREIAASRATFFPAVPTLIRALCVAQVDASELAMLERVISAGSPLSPEVARDFYTQYGKYIHNFYGSSETGGICFDTTGEATLSGRSVGTPLSNVCVDICDAGQVRVQSAAICSALADAQQRITLPDFGTLLPTGELRLDGRSGRVIKIGARRLDLSAWEAQARTVPGVEDAFAATGIRPGGESMLCAAIQTQLPVEVLHEKLQALFPRWQQPARLLTLSAFPQTARGKTDTATLRAQLSS